MLFILNILRFNPNFALVALRSTNKTYLKWVRAYASIVNKGSMVRLPMKNICE